MRSKSPRNGRSWDVTLVVEQLRRAVPGGIGTYARGLLRGLGTGGHSTSLSIGLYASRSPKGRDPLRELVYPLCTSKLPGPLMTRLWDMGHAGLSGSGVVHALSMAAPPTAGPLVVTVHDLAFRELPETLSARGRAWHEAAFARVVASADVLVVPSTEVQEAVIDAAPGMSADRVRIIAEGADHLPAPDGPSTNALLDRLGVRGRFILSVGTLEPRKNFDRLIAAFVQLAHEHDESLTLVICGPVGWGEHPSRADGVVFAGPVTNGVLAGLYARAHIVAYVPLREGFGLPAVEAMYQGAIVVASPVPSAHHGALLVDPYEVGAIAEGLWQASTDEGLRSQLRREALGHVELLTWENTARAHCLLWKEAAR